VRGKKNRRFFALLMMTNKVILSLMLIIQTFPVILRTLSEGSPLLKIEEKGDSSLTLRMTIKRLINF
jgi:hypothetical protein